MPSTTWACTTRSRGILFAGDAVGIKLPGVDVPLRPSTPPSDFDLDLALNSLHRFAARRPTGLALAHYGLLGQPDDVLEEAEETLRRWALIAEQAFHSGEDIEAALRAAYGPQTEALTPDARNKLEVFDGIHSNAAGLRRWLEKSRPSTEHA